MRSINGEESSLSDGHGSSAHEEKILVSVRLRPLNEREISKNDISDWECVNNTTIMSKTSAQERPMSPTAYSFDRVFGDDSSTRQVYEEGAKKVALSVINGINASIFAYGQTSSGKTYTMSGITEYTLSDIYNHVTKHETREFVLKFAALEIYNECVRDLLTSGNTALRLLDDPERGTVVEKLTEVTLRDWDQLKELLSFCEAQRQVGETNLNETSSRSHQILRLTVESSTRKYSTSRNSDALTATVNFVDLAGSERASQTMSVNTRLKEGCHINRSLLTLGTVIRKLSKGRNGHVPYRDSKLTRILQNSLGGNARTAIICTLSPAHSHVEQSRNTLLFASCAKQVTNTAQVNVVMSEKALVKLLQKELARLNKQLKNLGSLSSGSCDSLSALQEKERLIEKMDKEIRQLTQQRDLANSRLQILQQVGGQSGRSLSWADSSSLFDSSQEIGMWQEYYSPSELSEIVDPFRSEIASIASQGLSDRYEGTIGSNKIEDFEGEEQLLSDDLSPTKVIDKYFGPDPCLEWEKVAHTSNKNIKDICKDVQYVEVEVDKCSVKYEEITSHQSLRNQELKADNDNETSNVDAQDMMKNASYCLDDISHPKEEGSSYSSDIDNISISSRSDDNISGNKSCGAVITIGSSDVTKDCENVIQSGFEEETPDKLVEANNLKVFDELNHDNKKQEDKGEISCEEKVDQQQNNLKVFDELNHDNKKHEDKAEISIEEKVDQQQNNLKVFNELNYDNKKREDESEISSEEKVDQQQNNLKVFDELNRDNEEFEDRTEISSEENDDQHPNTLKICDELNRDNEEFEDRTEISREENVDQHPNTLKVCDELNRDNEKFEDREDKSETSNEENVEQQHDCSTAYKEDYDLKCHDQFGDHSKDTIQNKKLECSLPNENFVENVECQKQILDNHVSNVSTTANENLECKNQLEDDNVRKDKLRECQNLIVDNHVSEDDNIECENRLVDNPTSVVVSSIDNDNFQHEEQYEDNHVLEMEPTSDKQQDLSRNNSEVVDDSQLSSSNCSKDFEKQRQEIIELWNACNVPLVHRTYFFLLFKGEPSDAIYMEVEQRRLSYLKGILSRSSETAGLKALRREREKLRRQMVKKFSAKERESLYEKWGIALKSKRRRLQLCSRLWTNTKDLEHIKKSAALVAKLVGLVEPNHAPKEIFGLSLPQSTPSRSYSWQGLPSLL